MISLTQGNEASVRQSVVHSRRSTVTKELQLYTIVDVNEQSVLDFAPLPIMTLPFPDPDSTPETDVVIYDGECSFCKTQVARLRSLDWFGPRLSYLSLHDPRVKDRYPNLTYEQLMEQMYVIDQKEKPHGGSEAVRYLTRRLPLLWLAAPLLHLPGTAWLWRWGYQQIAKRRYKISGRDKTCQDGACAVHLNR